MTTRVYMTGNPAFAYAGQGGGTIAFYDADTGAELHLMEANLLLTAITVPMIEFREVNSGVVKRAELVPPPPSNAGRILHHFAVDVEHDDVRDETVVRAAWNEYEERADGTLAPYMPAPLLCDERIPDIELMHASDPHAYLKRKIGATLAVLTYKLVDKAADTAAKNAPPVPKRTGGVVRNAPNFGGNGPVHIAPLPPGAHVIPHNGPLHDLVRPFVRDAVKKIITQLTCDECKGTGWYQGLHRREPCSKGCKPQ